MPVFTLFLPHRVKLSSSINYCCSVKGRLVITGLRLPFASTFLSFQTPRKASDVLWHLLYQHYTCLSFPQLQHSGYFFWHYFFNNPSYNLSTVYSENYFLTFEPVSILLHCFAVPNSKPLTRSSTKLSVFDFMVQKSI